MNDNRHRIIRFEKLFFGTIDATSVYPGVVVQRALGNNAAALMLAHNHPSGNTERSGSVKQITKRLKEALGLIDVRVLDHFVVGEASVAWME
ncbi:MAG: JAB domain-containing protein [Methylococcales bacterium]